jgi:SAM-dependent methyltransferase
VSRIDTHVVFDLAQTPLPADVFDAVICIHVLEHVAGDRKAICEIFRVLRPGGWAMISVPIRVDKATFEDPTITSPEARKKAFGEKTHMRTYGADFVDRLREPGFTIETYKATDVEDALMEKYGLRDDEVIFFCTKP